MAGHLAQTCSLQDSGPGAPRPRGKIRARRRLKGVMYRNALSPMAELVEGHDGWDADEDVGTISQSKLLGGGARCR